MIKLDTSDGRFVLDVLSGLSKASFFEPLDTIGADFIARIRLGFRTSTDPYGNEWADVDREGQPLRKDGFLEKSFAHSATRNILRVGSPLIYAATHNEGLMHVKKRQIIPGDEMPTVWADDVKRVMDEHLQEIATNAAR